MPSHTWVYISTPPSKHYTGKNYPFLFKKWSYNLDRWKESPPPSHSLEWLGRLNSIQMNILPRNIYKFRTLPKGICKKVLTLVYNKILKFIWDDKRPRVNKQTCYTPKQKRGLGMPNLLKYFQVAQIAHLIKLNSQNQISSWLAIETYACNQ